ncbi:unnamed protein product [Hermetia illucens]|uniref:Fork-head domain-containing protein n=1 Tax=Hermetia illucens TaxID=343691 RepID=A0A7R8YNB4_HERIL|nr:forkhead box protein G1-like [Hermetia illucens]CAD7079368.1 unnamed protein product [Hermetia illucens]
MAFQSNFSINSILGEEVTNDDHSVDRPKYSYGALIMMAIKASPKGRLTLAEIYEYITNNYEYYRTCKTDWQNAIRNNLSMSEHFIRMPREYDDPGRGGYWTLAAQYGQLFVGDDTGRLRQPPVLPIPCHLVPGPAMQGVAYQYVNCSIPGCMCYQMPGPIPQAQQMYVNMQQM